MNSMLLQTIETPHYDFSKISTEDLKDKLAKGLKNTAESLLYTAEIVKELEVRGEDLSFLRHGMGRYLYAIAGGELAPEVIVKYGGNRSLINALAKLPLCQQKDIATSDMLVPVVSKSSTGYQEEVKNVDSFSQAELQTAFAPSGIRTKNEQIKYLEERQLSKEKGQKAKTVKIDEKTKCVKIGHRFVPFGDRNLSATDVVNALSEYYKIDLMDYILKNAEKI